MYNIVKSYNVILITMSKLFNLDRGFRLSQFAQWETF